MNRQHDIDRTLDAWFVDGPAVMPDRLFDAVFDQVERTPQRRLARISLRFTEMNPRIRLFTVLAAVLLVVVAAIAVIGGGSQGLIKASPSPSPAATAAGSDGPVPVALAGTWMGRPGGLTGLDPDAGKAVVFSNSNFWMTQANQENLLRVRSRAVDLGGGRVMLTGRPADQDCSDGDVGIYSYSLLPDGQELSLTAESDECATRSNVLPGIWELVDCESQDHSCLGVLDSGRHSSQFFDPFVPSGTPWTPRYAVLAYTVPLGWKNVADWPGTFSLAPHPLPGGDMPASPDPAAGDTAIHIFTDVVAVSEEDPCQEVKATGVGETAQDIATWVSEAPGVIATKPEKVTVGGLDAWRLDISMDPSWSSICSFDTKPGRGLFTDRPTTEGFHWGLGPDTHMRIYLADMGRGRAMLIDIESDQTADWDRYVAEATTIVESFQFQTWPN